MIQFVPSTHYFLLVFFFTTSTLSFCFLLFITIGLSLFTPFPRHLCLILASVPFILLLLYISSSLFLLFCLYVFLIPSFSSFSLFIAYPSYSCSYSIISTPFILSSSLHLRLYVFLLSSLSFSSFNLLRYSYYNLFRSFHFFTNSFFVAFSFYFILCSPFSLVYVLCVSSYRLHFFAFCFNLSSFP